MEKLESKMPVLDRKLTGMQHLKIYSKQDILSLTKLRRFETKLGERLQIVHDPAEIEKSIASSTAKYVLFGDRKSVV